MGKGFAPVQLLRREKIPPEMDPSTLFEAHFLLLGGAIWAGCLKHMFLANSLLHVWKTFSACFLNEKFFPDIPSIERVNIRVFPNH